MAKIRRMVKTSLKKSGAKGAKGIVLILAVTIAVKLGIKGLVSLGIELPDESIQQIIDACIPLLAGLSLFGLNVTKKHYEEIDDGN